MGQDGRAGGWEEARDNRGWAEPDRSAEGRSANQAVIRLCG